MKRIELKLVFILIIFFTAACNKNTKTSESEDAKELTSEKVDSAIVSASDDIANKPTYQVQYVLADVLNIRKEPSLSGEVITKLNIGDSLLFMNERAAAKTSVIWQGRTYNSSMQKVQLNDGQVGWAYGPMIGSKTQLDGHQHAEVLRQKFPELVLYEGFYFDYQRDESTDQLYIYEACDCGPTGALISFHNNGYKINEPEFSATSCGEAYPLTIKKVEKSTYDGKKALIITGLDHNNNENNVTIFNTLVNNKNVMGFQFAESDMPRYVVNSRYTSQFEYRQESCEDY